MIELKLKCVAEDGGVYWVDTITSNEDSVANLIAEGQIAPCDRWREVARLYKGQLAAKQRELVSLREALQRKDEAA